MTGLPWRLLADAPAPGAWNMAADEAMLEAMAAGVVGPTLRLYGWEPACLSLGRNQTLPNGLAERAALLGIDVVRRPTGGQAVLHAAEITYSVVTEAGTRGVLGDYRHLNGILVRALAEVGFPADLIRTEASGQRGEASCFARPGRADLAVAGHKIGGSAQVRRGGLLLQHGSIKLWPASVRLADVLGPGTPEPVALWPDAPPEAPEAWRSRLERALAHAFGLAWHPEGRTSWEHAWIATHRARVGSLSAAGT